MGNNYFIGIEGFCTTHGIGILGTADGTILAAHRQGGTIAFHVTRPVDFRERLIHLVNELLRSAGLREEALLKTGSCMALSGGVGQPLVELIKVARADLICAAGIIAS